MKSPTQDVILAALEQNGGLTAARIASLTGRSIGAIHAAMRPLRAAQRVHVETQCATSGRDANVYALGAGPDVPPRRERADLPLILYRDPLPVRRQAPADLTAQAVANRSDLELAWGGGL